MILSDNEIRQMLKEKSLLIEPIEENQIQPASVDIRLGDSFCMMNDCKSGIINIMEKPEYINITREKIILFPGQFILGTTMEYIKLPDNLTAFVEGRSSLGRLDFSSRMQDGLTPDLRARLPWSCSMQADSA